MMLEEVVTHFDRCWTSNVASALRSKADTAIGSTSTGSSAFAFVSCRSNVGLAGGRTGRSCASTVGSMTSSGWTLVRTLGWSVQDQP